MSKEQTVARIVSNINSPEFCNQIKGSVTMAYAMGLMANKLSK